MEPCGSKKCCHIPPYSSVTHSHKVTTTCHQVEQQRQALACSLCCVSDSLLGAIPLVSTRGQSCCKNRGTNTGETDVGASRWAEEGWHFLDGPQKAVSSHITSQYTPHRGTHITHPMWLDGEGSPSMADKMNKSADQEAGKKWRWPGRFVWVGHSVIIMHGCLGRDMTLPVAQHLAGNCCEETSFKEKFETPSNSHTASYLIPSGPLV